MVKVQIWVVMRTSLFNTAAVSEIVYSEEEAERLVNEGNNHDNSYVYEGPFDIDVPEIVKINNNTGPINITM